MLIKYATHIVNLLCALLSCSRAIDKTATKFEKVLFSVFTAFFIALAFIMCYVGGNV